MVPQKWRVLVTLSAGLGGQGDAEELWQFGDNPHKAPTEGEMTSVIKQQDQVLKGFILGAGGTLPSRGPAWPWEASINQPFYLP